MKTNRAILTLFLCLLLKISVSAVCDTIYLTSDSSLVITTYCEYDEVIYDLTVRDNKKNLLLLEISEPVARVKLLKISNDSYHIAAETNLPVYGQDVWRPCEFVRYIIEIQGSDYSFRKTYKYTNYQKLSKSQLTNITLNATNILSNDFVRNRYLRMKKDIEGLANDSYVRNVGFLALGILNGNDTCLQLFNEASEKCTGGEGCEAYSELQLMLTYTEYKLVDRISSRSFPPFNRSLVKRNVP